MEEKHKGYLSVVKEHLCKIRQVLFGQFLKSFRPASHLLFVQFVTDSDAGNGKSSGQEEPVDPNLHPTQNTSEIKPCDQPAEGSDENEADNQKETKQEQKHKPDQSQEQEKDREVAAAAPPQPQQEAVPDQEEAQGEGDTCRDSEQPEDTEQVETFFSTMSHRYENAIQEGHIL